MLRVKPVRHDDLCFEVIDTGVGINASEIKTILEPFRQVHGNSSGGTGLGLPISGFLLEAMNSELHIRSEPGKGSTFYFSLPLIESGETNVQSCPGAVTQTGAPRPVQHAQAQLLDKGLFERVLIKPVGISDLQACIEDIRNARA